MFSFLQTTPPPADLGTLQWIIILALSGVVTFLYRQLLKTQADGEKASRDLLEKTLLGLSDNNQAIGELADAMEALREQLSLKREIEELRREFRNANKG